MAQKVRYLLICDLHEGEVEGVETLSFGLDGKTYEMDLCKKHAKEVRDTVGRYVGSARKLPGRARTSRSTGRSRARRNGKVSGSSTADVRTWAMENGYDVGERGRIPAAVVDAYQAAH